MSPQEAFVDVLLAGMRDAADGHFCQLKTTVSPDGKKIRVVRIIIVPEEMDFNFSKEQPLGADPAKS